MTGPRAAALGAMLAAIPGCDLVFTPTLDDDAPLVCPDSYVAVGELDTRYRYDPTARSWFDAETTCRADRIDSATHLVVLTGFTELAAVRAAAPWAGTWGAWVGYARDFGSDETRFYAVTGEPLAPTSNLWEPGEPTGEGELAVFLQSRYDLSDGGHGLQFGSICACDGREPVRAFDLP